MERKRSNTLYGIGGNSTLPNNEEQELHRYTIDNIKRDLHLINRVRNRALISDLASGLVNLIARRKGSRMSLPTDATEKYNNTFLQLNDKLHMAQRDYEGAIARKKIFTPPKQSNTATTAQNAATNKALPKATLLQPISSFNVKGKDAGISINNSMKVVEKWRRDKMILPKWYSNKKIKR